MSTQKTSEETLAEFTRKAEQIKLHALQIYLNASTHLDASEQSNQLKIIKNHVPPQ